MLLLPAGTVRQFDFAEPFPDSAGELHLRGPIRGHARLTRTSEGILVHAEYRAPVVLECARCLEEALANISGRMDEEFLPSTDIRTGLPLDVPDRVDDQPLIDEHHEIDLDEVLRQNILTQLPLRPLCDDACPGLCATCGQRLDTGHRTHPESADDDTPAGDAANPFAGLAVLLKDDQER